MYRPNPIDTSSTPLPPEILELAELLSKNTHEVWAAGRQQDGWSYGPVRDDVAKTHPCLIPYEDLSEVEKDYDRATALGTLQLILHLGYTIKKVNPANAD